MINFNGQFNLSADFCCGDKSISHRALILASIADGTCKINNVSLCQDVMSTANCLRALGAEITFFGNCATVKPIVTPNDNVTLHCENSGTTARLVAGLVAGLDVTAKFVGDSSLSQRPMQRVLEPLRQMGAVVDSGGMFTLVRRNRTLHGIDYVSPVNSAQVKSAVLIAGLFANGTTTYTESATTRNHTEILLNNLGLCNKTTVQGLCGAKVKAFEITIPNDFSSVAFGVQLALLSDTKATFVNVGVNPTRTGMLDCLVKSGAKITLQNQRTQFGEPVADLTVEPSVLSPLFADKTTVCRAIDEVPSLATIALFVAGKHEFDNVAELRNKECDRIEAIIQTAKAFGQNAYLQGDNLVVESNGIIPSNAVLDSHNDHRIAMSQSVACIACGGGRVNVTPYQVSFPDFLQAIGVTPKRFALIGNGICNSLSPRLITHLANNVNLCCSYELYNLSSDATDSELLDAIGKFDGVNVTMPFKTRIAQLLKANTNSVNTVGKNVLPTSTDGFGVVQALTNDGIDVSGKPLWIIGAGGTSESAIQALQQAGAKLQVFNRSKQKADLLTAKYGLQSDITNPYGVLSFVPTCDYEDTIPLPQSVQFVMCANYTSYSALKNKAKTLHLRYVDGVEMLYFQGTKSFSLWTNTPLQNDYDKFAEEIK